MSCLFCDFKWKEDKKHSVSLPVALLWRHPRCRLPRLWRQTPRLKQDPNDGTVPKHRDLHVIDLNLFRRDLLDALNDVSPEDIHASMQEQQHSTDERRVCKKCGSTPPAGDKLRYCGRCEVTTYCSRQCARADWAKHKLVCETLRVDHKEALAAYEARGGQNKDYNQMTRDTLDWFAKVPGLRHELELLAWKHRSEAPYMHAETVLSDTDGSGIRVGMVPRRIWAEDPGINKGPSSFCAQLQRMFSDDSSFCAEEQYVCGLNILNEGKSEFSKLAVSSFDHTTIRGAEIVEALTAGTGAEELADAFAWIESAFPAHAAQHKLQTIRTRATSLHGSTTLAGSVPVPTRAINNEVACMILNGLYLEIDICLTGLRGAAHLNGREGIMRGPDPANGERWKVRLDDGTCVSAKAANFVLIRRGEYTRKSP